MGCRFSRTDDTESKLTSNSTDLITGTVNRPLLATTDHLFDSQSILASDTAEVLNPTIVSGENPTVKETIIPIDYKKNAHTLARWNTSIRSTFCNRFTIKPKMSLDPEIQESDAIRIQKINKPITQIESASQVDFFRMLDEKIAQGCDDLIDSDAEK